MEATATAKSAWEACAPLRGRDLLSVRDLTHAEMLGLLALAADVKHEPARYAGQLHGRAIAMIFEKPSLRTRVSFDVAGYHLGARVIALSPGEVGLGARETIPDVGRTLDRFVDAIIFRTFEHERVEELARASAVPVINGLSDFTHPCQALADYLTMREVKGRLKGLRLAFVGDGNNVANSLIMGGALLGVAVTVATPPGYEPPAEVLEWAKVHATATGPHVVVSPDEAVAEADVVYTDTWVSMGQEAEAEERRRAFGGYRITEDLMGLASPDAVFMHCLPAHRGEEVTAAVIDSPQSVVFTQAENRLHTEKALLLALLG